MSVRKSFHHQIELPSSFDAESIAQAIRENTRSILFGNLTRRQYHEAAFHADDLRDLPLGHLFNHCVRGPASAFVDQAAIERTFNRMLVASDAPHALRIVANALSLSPANDAEILWKAGEQAPDFMRLCRKGYLAKAIGLIPAGGWNDLTRDRLLSLVSNIAIYHAAFQVQLIAARAWLVDHLPTALEYGAGPYRQAAVIRDMIKTAEAVGTVDDYLLEKMERPPRAKLIADLKALAKAYVAQSDRSVGELEKEILAVFPSLAKRADKARRFMARQQNTKNAQGSEIKNGNWSVHRAIYNYSASFCLAFSVKRLLQLSDVKQQITKDISESKPYRLPATLPADFPKNNRKVKNVLFTYRYIYDIALKEKGSVPTEVPLLKIIDDKKARGNSLNTELLKKVSAEIGRLSISREEWSGRMALGDAQRFDVLTEYLFRSAPTKPPATSLLAQARKKRDKDKNHRPPNVRRASGKGNNRGLI